MPDLIDIYHSSDHIIEQPAFESLTFVETVKAPRQEYFAKYKSRDEDARARYRQIASKPMAESEIYVLDIIRNNWKNGQGI